MKIARFPSTALSIAKRVLILARLEVSAIHYPQALRRASVIGLPGRWFAVGIGRRQFRWQKIITYSETRFEPVLMHLHQELALELVKNTQLRPGARVLDIGGNAGQFALCMLNLRPDLEIVSLEPNLEVLEILNANIAARDASNWDSIPCGLDTTDSTRTFYYVAGRSGQGSLYAKNASLDMIGHATQDVVAANFTFLCADSLRVIINECPTTWDLIKVDVEGHEAAVLPELCKLGFRYLAIEVGPHRDGSLNASQLLDELTQLGLPCRVIAEHRVRGSILSDLILENCDSVLEP